MRPCAIACGFLAFLMARRSVVAGVAAAEFVLVIGTSIVGY
jgi:hypothetical protein